MGMERLILLLKHYGLALSANANAYFVSLGEAARLQTLLLTEQCRTVLPALAMVNHCGEGSFKSQMKRADKSGADIAIILGEDELQNQQVSIKYLRIKQEQETIAQTELVNRLQQIF
jgi:histidyl-tRNA synthetase